MPETLRPGWIGAIFDFESPRASLDSATKNAQAEPILSCSLRGEGRLLFARLDLRRIAPEIFKLVEIADVFAHYVNNHVKVVQDDPGGVDRAIRSARTDLLIFFEVFLDFVNDGTQVGFARAGADNEIIGDAGNFAEIEDNDVFSLFIVRQFPTEQRQFP